MAGAFGHVGRQKHVVQGLGFTLSSVPMDYCTVVFRSLNTSKHSVPLCNTLSVPHVTREVPFLARCQTPLRLQWCRSAASIVFSIAQSLMYVLPWISLQVFWTLTEQLECGQRTGTLTDCFSFTISGVCWKKGPDWAFWKPRKLVNLAQSITGDACSCLFIWLFQ